MTIIDILLAVLIIAACALCVYLIISLKKLNQTVEILQKDVHGLYEKTLPLLENLTEITEKSARITSEAEDYWRSITDAVERVRTKISNFGATKSSRSDSNSIEDFIRNFRAIFKGITTFWETIKK